MRHFVAAATSIAAMASNMALAEEPRLAPEGRGLLQAPAAMSTSLGGSPPHPFLSDPSGHFSRTIFETGEISAFKVIIRDFSFPPDKQPHTITLPSATFLHWLDGAGEIRIAKQRVELTPPARTSVPAGAPIEVVNNGDRAIVLRALIVEEK